MLSLHSFNNSANCKIIHFNVFCYLFKVNTYLTCDFINLFPLITPSRETIADIKV